MKGEHRIQRLILGLSIVAILGAYSCSDSGSGGDDNSSQPDLAIDAIIDMNTSDSVLDTEIEIDGSDRSVARTKLMIVFKPTATRQQMDDLIASLNATITISQERIRGVVIRIPDPGSLNAYQAIVDSVASEPFVDFVWQGEMSQPGVLPDNYSTEPPDAGELDYLEHQIAINGPAAWNLKRTIQSVPQMLVVDWFGKLNPTNNTVDINNYGLFLDTPPGHDHGYHVLGIMAGTFGQHLITGVFPSTMDLYVIDKMAGLDMPTTMMMIIEQLRIIPGKIIVNTSIVRSCDGTDGFCTDVSVAEQEALFWIEAVRQYELENRVLFVTCAGNIKNPPGFEIRDAGTNFYIAAAGVLGGLMDEGGNPVQNLTNALVVENGQALDMATSGVTAPECLSDMSFVNGNSMGIGTDVWSYNDTTGSTVQMSGCSMATPQVAGLAAYLWAVQPDLTPQQIVSILSETGTQLVASAAFGCSDWPTPSPVVNAYEALLSLDAAAEATPADSPMRLALLDVSGDGAFDETDLTALVLRYYGTMDATEMIEPQENEYGRYDLNGDGMVGGCTTESFDLDRSGSSQYGAAHIDTVTKVIHDKTFRFNEETVTDMDIVCYYGNSDLYTGDAQARDDLLTIERCSEAVVINDTYIHLGDSSDEVPLSFTGTASNLSIYSFASATLEIEFPYGYAGGIDLVFPPTITFNGTAFGINDDDLDPDPSCQEISDWGTGVIGISYHCSFTARYDVSDIINRDEENTLVIQSSYKVVDYDDFGIGEIRILLH